MEDKNMMTELEQMREQMQMLRNKLEQQEIVNDKLVKNSIKSKMSWIKKFVYFEFCLLPFLALTWFCIKEYFDLSWYNYAFMMVMCTVDVVWDYRINVASLKIDRVEDNSLTDTMQKLISMKQIRAKAFIIMGILLILWLVWTGIEVWQYLSTMSGIGDAFTAGAYGGFAGGVIGAFAGLYLAFRIYRKMQNTNDELIAQISEFADK